LRDPKLYKKILYPNELNCGIDNCSIFSFNATTRHCRLLESVPADQVRTKEHSYPPGSPIIRTTILVGIRNSREHTRRSRPKMQSIRGSEMDIVQYVFSQLANEYLEVHEKTNNL
jgi:hypothetical protein